MHNNGNRSCACPTQSYEILVTSNVNWWLQMFWCHMSAKILSKANANHTDWLSKWCRSISRNMHIALQTNSKQVAYPFTSLWQLGSLSYDFNVLHGAILMNSERPKIQYMRITTLSRPMKVTNANTWYISDLWRSHIVNFSWGSII